jgi:hypothetical protein
MNDQLGLLLRRERLGQKGRCGRLHGPLKELSDLNTSGKIFCVVIITTDKERISSFVLILIINKLCFVFLGLWIIIFILLILTLSFFRFIFAGRGRLNEVNLRSFVGGRSRSRRTLNIRSNRFGIGVRGLLLAQGQTQGSMLQQLTNKTLTTSPFGNTCEADEVSPEV